MGVDAIATLVILLGVLVLLVTEWVPAGVTGMLAVAALVLTGAMTSEAALAGFSNPAVITVASMYVISAAVARTGAAAVMANRLTRSGSPMRAYLGLLLATMLLSGFVNNTPLILIFLPLILGLAPKLGEAPSRLLIPLSYVSILGGSVTLIGTSTNLIVAASLEGESGGTITLGMFDFARLGVILALVGGVVVVLFRKRLLPNRPSLGLLTQQGVAAEYVTEVTVAEEGGLTGRPLGEVQEAGSLGEGTRVLQVVRGEAILRPRPDLHLKTGDLLLVKGDPDDVLRLRMTDAPELQRSDSVRAVALTLFEVVVTPRSRWIGRTVKGLALGDTYDAHLVALQRHGAHLREKIDSLTLHVGDVLLVQGTEESMHRLRRAAGVLVVEGVEKIVKDTKKAPLTLLALAGFVALAVSGAAPIEIAALAAAVFCLLTRCLNFRGAQRAIGWDVIFLIVGTLALGQACKDTGLAKAAAEALIDGVASFGDRAVIGVLLVFTALLTQVLSNNATAAVMTPLAYQLGLDLGGDPMPYVMAVAFGANCSFMTPVSYNTNLIVYGPGGYRFGDFLKLGVPLSIVFLVLATILLPILY